MRWQQLKYRLTNALRRFFYGRNGPDQLSLTLFVLSLVFSIVAQIARFPWLLPVYYALLLVCFFRMLSRNTYKRQRENAWFLSKVRGVASAVKLRIKMLREHKSYKYLKCTCKQRLRVPRGKGKIQITCPKCGRKIVKKV